MTISSAGSAVCYEIRMRTALQCLADAVFWDIKSNSGISTGESYGSVWCVVDAINCRLQMKLNLSDEKSLQRFL